MATLAELEKRIRNLEDIEAIKKLTIRALRLADSKYQDGVLKGEKELEIIAREIASLYSENATLDLGEFGKVKGKQAIYERHKTSPFNFAIHFFVMPEIELKGDTASGSWYLLLAATLKNNTAVWMSAIENYEYAKVADCWLFTYKKADFIFATPYDQGWAKKGKLG